MAVQDVDDLVERMVDADASIGQMADRAFSRLDYQTLCRVSRLCGSVKEEIQREVADHELLFHHGRGDARDELVQYLSARADIVTELHRESFEALADEGLSEVLGEFGPLLSQFPSDFTVPAHDLEFVSKEELTAALERAREVPWTEQGHRDHLDAASETRERLLKEVPSEPSGEDGGGEEPGDDSTLFSRYAGPALRILAGTALTTANASLGITAGLASTVTTIGATAVPMYLGVATSMYTGLTQVAEGLEKIGRRK